MNPSVLSIIKGGRPCDALPAFIPAIIPCDAASSYPVVPLI